MSSSLCFARHWLYPLGVWFLAISLQLQPAKAERPAAVRLFPKDTFAYFSVTDTQDLKKRFMETAAGQMSQDPQLKPLIDQLYVSLTEAASPLEDRLGLTLTELLSLPQGEIALGVVARGDGPAVLALLSTGDQPRIVDTLLDRGSAGLIQVGATQQSEKVDGTELMIYTFPGDRARQVIYFVKDGTLAIGTNINLMKNLLTVWNGGQGTTLAENEHFASIARNTRGAKGEEPQLTWFIDPVEGARSLGQGNSNAQIGLALLPALGLDGLHGIGGSVTFATEQFDTITRVQLLLETPRAGVVEAIALGTGDVTPEKWVPADVASYTTFYWKADKTYQKLTNLVDSFQGQGALKRLVQRAFDQAEVDLEQDILPVIDGRITLITLVEQPITPMSQGNLVGIKLKDPAKMQQVMDKLVSRFEASLLRKSFGGKTYYQGNPPRLAEAPEEARNQIPCVGIVGDYLMIGRSSMLEKVILTDADGSNPLGKSLDFKLIASKAERQVGGANPAMLSFNRPEEGMKFLYGLATADSTRQSLQTASENNDFLRNVNRALNDNPLPPFSVLQKYLAPGGGVVIDDESGIRYTGFTLRRAE